MSEITRGTTPRSGERAPVGSPVDERWAGAEEAPVPLGAREDAGIEQEPTQGPTGRRRSRLRTRTEHALRREVARRHPTREPGPVLVEVAGEAADTGAELLEGVEVLDPQDFADGEG